MPFIHPIYDPRKDDEDLRDPPMTEEQLDYFSEQTRHAVKKAVHNYSRGALLAFAILVAGIIGVQYSQDHQNHRASEAVVMSTRAVAVTSCNRDFHFTQKIRGILVRLKRANEAAYKAGRIDATQFTQAQLFYSGELDRLNLPDCRAALNVTADPSESRDQVPPPVPLHP